MNIKILTCFIFFISITLISQEIKLSGIITDNLENPLINANILAFPNTRDGNTIFAISNKSGRYTLNLEKNVQYSIEISHLGFLKIIHKFYSQKKTTKNFNLNPSTNKLDEVVINFKIPIEIKEDTVIYNTDAFVNGQERKLREILRKLPGIEVDREGNVTAKGKKVTKVMVENKIFFTGDSKLAVNNIPANAVDQIEILDNYSDVTFLKGLQESTQMAMNIRLKKNKKKFIFGDIEAGTGIQNRYLAHPTLFYYSPKNSLSFIGNLNNTGAKSFTLTDYLEFQGGFSKLMSNTKSYLNLFNDDFFKYLSNSNSKENINNFGAFNIQQSVSTKTDINSYFIANKSTTETENQSLNVYSNNQNPFAENRTTIQRLKNFFAMGKLTLAYKPKNSVDLSANTFIKLSNNNAEGTIVTSSPFQNNTFRTSSILDALNLKQNLEYSKKFSKAHTISLEVTLDFIKNKPNTRWLTNEPFLNNLILLENDSNYDVFQQKETKNTSFDFIFKDYWVLNNFNHIYTTFGSNLVSESFLSLEEQNLNQGGTNSFSTDGFGNDISYHMKDIFVGIEYKFLIGIFTSKAGLFYHNYAWKNEQFGNLISKKTSLLLPQLSVESKFSSSEKLNFRYQSRTRFPNSPKLIGNFILSNFNQVFRGNPNLSNEQFHSISLNYYKFSLFRGLNLNIDAAYTKKTQSIKSTTELEGIDQFRTLTMFNIPENNLTGSFGLSKKINNLKYSLETNVNYNEFFQIVNTNTSKNISKSFSTKGKIETFFKKTPNIEIGYTHSPSVFKTTFSSSNFTNNELFVNLNYDFLNDFQFKSDYSRFDYRNKEEGISDVFDMANASLFYQKEGSPWGFELEATNLFNTQFKRSNSFSDFMIRDQTTFILPRIILFKISYKL